MSPNISAPGTSFTEDNFSKDGGGGIVQVIMWGKAHEASLTSPNFPPILQPDA